MRLLFVAMPSSVHTARWISQISDKGWDIHLFPSTPDLIHPGLRNVTVYGVSVYRPKDLDPSVRLRGVWPFRKGSGLISYLAQRYQAQQFSPWALATIIRWLKPDIVHSTEIRYWVSSTLNGGPFQLIMLLILKRHQPRKALDL
jgi:hypothetical protein